jgi:hypothetical protein
VYYGPYGPPPILLSAGGSFGVSGPNEAAKRKFMRRTDRMRDAMSVRARERRLDAATVRVSADVVAIWRDASVPLSIRKQRIFALWDEAEAPVGDTGPLANKRAETETLVRGRIEAAVRLLAPAGSESAFTEVELRELNATRSGRARFEPYRASASAKSRDTPKVPPPRA